MRRFTAAVVSLAVLLLLGACCRRSLTDQYRMSATIPVVIYWDDSGISPNDPELESDYVHRVSLRFFPTDGSAVFERYLEVDIEQGTIEVPVGTYDVVVMNEAVGDTYWKEAIYFTDVDDFSNFAAHLAEDDPSNYTHYELEEGEQFATSLLKLASWSMEGFVVSEAMVCYCRSESSDSDMAQLTTQDQEMMEALSYITMRRLTVPLTVEVSTQYLSSAQSMRGTQRGLANTVYMASAQSGTTTSVHAFTFTGRTWHDDEQQHGTVSESFLTFGPPAGGTTYLHHLDVTLTDGTTHDPETAMIYDVSDQITASIPSSSTSAERTTTRNDVSQTDDMTVQLELELPELESSIAVSDWGDEQITILK